MSTNQNNPLANLNIKPLSEDEIKKLEADKKSITKRLIINEAELEAELESFNTIEDILYNPKTGNPMAVVRRMTMAELDVFSAKNLRKYKNEEEIPEEVAEEQDRKLYELFAEIITKPKHDADWWKAHITPELVAVFQKHLEKTLTNLGSSADNFR